MRMYIYYFKYRVFSLVSFTKEMDSVV
jgi:hypothetical protein